jgi:hypothetical protein
MVTLSKELEIFLWHKGSTNKAQDTKEEGPATSNLWAGATKSVQGWDAGIKR